jgi:hypothetical protein
MSKDTSFLFHPGEASEDTQFMNRLERGCYFDLLKAQKKFGGNFTLDQIKKVLGNDFDACWPAVEIVLKKEEEQYFINWVNNPVKKRKSTPKSKESPDSPELLVFDEARKLFPGDKNGKETEFENFKNKHEDWREVLPILKDKIAGQISHRAKLAELQKSNPKIFIKQWKMFSTWINKRSWEEEVSSISQTPTVNNTHVMPGKINR